MDIESLPAKSKCLVDANILLYHIAGASSSCRGFLDRVAVGDFQPYLSTIIVAETLHRQMLIEASIKGLVTTGKTLNKLKTNPAIISKLTDYVIEVEKLLQLPFTIVEVTRADLTESHKLRLAYGLFVNDSINLACAQASWYCEHCDTRPRFQSSA